VIVIDEHGVRQVLTAAQAKNIVQQVHQAKQAVQQAQQSQQHRTI
jgi:hypothetical protein